MSTSVNKVQESEIPRIHLFILLVIYNFGAMSAMENYSQKYTLNTIYITRTCCEKFPIFQLNGGDRLTEWPQKEGSTLHKLSEEVSTVIIL